MLSQLLHVQVASARHPFLGLLDGQRSHQPQARLRIREDPYQPRPTLYLLVEPLLAVGRADAPAVTLGERQAAQALFDVFLEVLGDPLVALPSPLLGHGGGEPEGLLGARLGEDRAEVGGQLLALLDSHHPEQVSRVVYLAPLPRCPLEVARDGGLEALVAAGDDQLHTREPAHLQGAEQLLVGRLALGVRNLHAEDLPKAVGGAHARDDEDALAHHSPSDLTFS